MNITSLKEIFKMSTKALIRDNIILNINEAGLKSNIQEAKNMISNKERIHDRPLNILVIGGSSGYGLASRIALGEKTYAQIVNVSFERAPKGKRAGSFGYYNNQFMLEQYPNTIDIMGDAFSFEIKDEVVKTYKENNQKIDLVVYSLASGIRIDPFTQEKYTSALKPIDKSYTGLNIDIAKEVLKEETLTQATQDEIDQTVKVMGGEDYYLWAKYLYDADVLNENVRFVTYTYVGPELTHAIYKNGTIGHAKRDLENANEKINNLIKPLHGKSYISQSKAVITKASIFIPTMALYASALFKVMKAHGTHESIVEHKYRLFKDFVFNNYEADHISLDAYEMDEKVQAEVIEILSTLNDENFKEAIDFESFKKEFISINGF